VRHIDLFTGLGGFTLASYFNGIKTVVMCEADKFRRNGLRKAWPGIPIIEDVRDFDGTKWTDAFILTAGVPCQPASRAGKQRGKEDDRWLWGEALRVVAEAKPCWCLFENPPGLGDVGLDGILADLEAIGYETGIADIPACAVNSPQLRHRLWIVANTSQTHGKESLNPGREARPQFRITGSGQGDMAHTELHGYVTTKERFSEMEQQKRWPEEQNGLLQYKTSSLRIPREPWTNYLFTPCADVKVRRTPDNAFLLDSRLYAGLSGELEGEIGLGFPRKVLAALGDSIVWPVAYEIIKAIKQVEYCK